MAVEWKEPKIDWNKNGDRFNIEDYNRIKNNLEYLHEKAVELYKQFDVQNMGEDYTSYKQYFYADQFNLFEKNLEIINNNVLPQDIGDSQMFYPNGKFIDYEELNRIENAMLSIKKIFENQEIGLRKIPFRLGAFRDIRI
ncbi:hypothetical protein OCV51_10390 [Faecalicatena acetigenes]|uniref:Uncharacterized protein n=1 Tax=Faecalicatena acetigenes TaxID=2981790 RepID=A0ABT2TCQ2_9FIRM|nr:hypothetical protein [Faecalicatena acetigenes]MCU6748054.1 hypothetical protein [Faecalicatena acetigenes]SCI23465.1 Uncharacterised protein [uncultured Clostridium sp.]